MNSNDIILLLVLIIMVLITIDIYKYYIKIRNMSRVSKIKTINIKIDNDKILNKKNIRDSINVEELDFKLVRKEYQTSMGRIDILVKNKSKRIPIEIKLGTAGDSAVGQILRYMTAVNSDEGIIIAKDFKYYLPKVCKNLNIKLIKYKLNLGE